ncbi:MAG TPA: hypothetical protein VIV07_09870, partial [Sphingomicrobium sp.]
CTGGAIPERRGSVRNGVFPPFSLFISSLPPLGADWAVAEMQQFSPSVRLSPLLMQPSPFRACCHADISTSERAKENSCAKSC